MNNQKKTTKQPTKQEKATEDANKIITRLERAKTERTRDRLQELDKIIPDTLPSKRQNLKAAQQLFSQERQAKVAQLLLSKKLQSAEMLEAARLTKIAVDNSKIIQRITEDPSKPYTPDAATLYGSAWPYVQGAKPGILSGLTKNNVEPFFHALQNFPVILTDREIYDRTIGSWWQIKHVKSEDGNQARGYLSRIGSVLADIHGAPEYATEEERKERIKGSVRKAKHEWDERKRKKKQ